VLKCAIVGTVMALPQRLRDWESTKMRISITVACGFMLWAVASCATDEPPRTGSKAKVGGPDVDAILREAREIALKQDKGQHFWTDRVLLDIGELQIHAGAYDGALKSIRGSNDTYGRDAGLEHLAEALARGGKRERAFENLRMQDYGWPENRVHLKWVESLIASGELGRAAKAIQELKYEGQRPEGLRMLAVAYAKSKGSARAREYFKLSIDTASGLKDESDRARALWQTADAQLAVGEADAAKATIRLLVEKTELKDPWARCRSFTECAVLTAKMKDDETAHRLFRRAIEARNAVDSMNKMNALMYIAESQAGVGYFDEALKTASMITSRDSYHDQALYAVAVAQLKADDAEGAVRTAMSIERYPQYRDDAVHKIVDHQIAKRDFKAALAAAEKAPNPSKKAFAFLKVATAYANSGDRKAAADVAGRIDLTTADRLPVQIRAMERFNYRLPNTWGVRYDDNGFGGTMAMHRWSSKLAAEVAGGAMTLAQALGEKPAESYAVLFNDINTEEIIQALARAHAASGNANEALAWAKKIGSGSRADSKDDKSAWAVERRIHALIGVAEGILERSGSLPPKQEP
jgi:tetratricopeptide (TPR) repeat protein